MSTDIFSKLAGPALGFVTGPAPGSVAGPASDFVIDPTPGSVAGRAQDSVTSAAARVVTSHVVFVVINPMKDN